MPTIITPNSDLARATFLRKAWHTGQQDHDADRFYLGRETLDLLGDLSRRIDAHYHVINSQLGNRVALNEQASEAVERLKTYVRDTWEFVRRLRNRERLATAVFAYYGLSQDGVSPALSNRDEWLSMAESVIAGDARAVAAGYPAVASPSAAETQAVLDSAKAALLAAEQADNEYEKRQRALAELRSEIDDLFRRVVAELRFRLYDREPSNQRRVMRKYGVRFRYRPGEQPDEDEQAGEEAVAEAPVEEIPALPTDTGAPEPAPVASNGVN